ncbi:MAG: S8 family serine peptidase [candidate division Zixibacteria bacterium]|nr:S8 family serine peptidase [candidate division Zixibacteria bacterium]MDH3936059.1 S8 family serine peptidase [candidate division Zixibacteria bacterium]
MLNAKFTFMIVAVLVLGLAVAVVTSAGPDPQKSADKIDRSAMSEETYQKLKAQGKLPQPDQVKPLTPRQLENNTIDPDAFERTAGLLIPLDASFTRLEPPQMRPVTSAMSGSKKSNSFEIKLKSRNFVPQADITAFTRLVNDSGQPGDKVLADVLHCVIQFESIPSGDERERLSDGGITLHKYLPENAYFASVDTRLSEQQLTDFQVRALFQLEIADKQAASIRNKTVGEWAKPVEGKFDLIVRYMPDVPIAEVERIMRDRGAEIIGGSSYFNRVTIRLNEARVNEVSAFPWVMWVAPIAPPPTIENDVSRDSINVTAIQASPYLLHGTGFNTGIWDGGPVQAHNGFAGRLTIRDNAGGYSQNLLDHATHVAGTMAGDGALSSNDSLRGMADSTNIFSWDFQGDIPAEMLAGVTNDNILISQNSWAITITAANCGDFGDYDSGSDDYDQLARDQDLLIVFAAGNYRNDGICGITIPGGYSSISPPAGAKNIITVGAINKSDGMTQFSDWGPTDDGRLKPEITAVGQSVVSTLPNNLYGSKNGTSMAAPAISGLSALLIDRYRELKDSTNPSPELIKSIILNTAKELGNPGPDYKYGYGKADGLQAVKTLEGMAWREYQIAQDSTDEWNLDVLVHTDTLRVMLAYSDEEAAVNANPTLVNNLNLKLIDPNGTEYLPLTLDPANPSNNAAQGVNDRDNVEQVVVKDPVAGKWKIRVSAPTVAGASGTTQDYAITWLQWPRFSAVPFTNGTPPLYRNDDGSSPLIPLSFPFCFYGTELNELYINNNGNLSFEGPYFEYSPSGFPISGFGMIAPFWGDVDTRNDSGGVVYYRSEPHRLTVIWDRVGYFGSHAEKLSTFEVIITDGTDTIVGLDKNVAFSYGDMQWTTGDASGGSNGFGGAPATAGANKGDGISYALVGRFDHEGIDYDGAGGNADGISYLDNTARRFNVCEGLGTIAGSVFDDVDDDCTWDATEDSLAGWTVTLEPGGLATTSDANGEYFFSFLQPNTYTVSVVPPPNWVQTCPLSPGTHVIALTAGQTFLDKDFGGRALANIQDLTVDVAGGPARPGFQKFYGITCKNHGTVPVANATVQLKLPSQLTHLESSPDSAYAAGTHTVSWPLGTMAPGETRWMWTKAQIPVNIDLGTILISTAEVHPLIGDDNQDDNTDSEAQTVRGSYDPNEKLVTPAGFGPDSLIRRIDTLRYQVNFQNVGTDTAFTVIVRDSLDSDIDPASLKIGAGSHPYTFNLVGTELVWTFDNILLPDSNTSEPGSHGFLTYDAAPRDGVPDGTVIENRAAIYFDFNAPVITNTTRNRISDDLAARTTIQPDTIYVYWAYAVDPLAASVYVGDFIDGHTTDMIDTATVLVNTTIAAVSNSILPVHPEFFGPPLHLTVPMKELILGYGPLFDTTVQTYTVSGQFNDADSFSVDGSVVMIGHIPGDANLDGTLDISDLVYVVEYFFAGGPPPLVLEVIDMDRNQVVDIADLILLVETMFGL